MANIEQEVTMNLSDNERFAANEDEAAPTGKPKTDQENVNKMLHLVENAAYLAFRLDGIIRDNIKRIAGLSTGSAQARVLMGLMFILDLTYEIEKVAKISDLMDVEEIERKLKTNSQELRVILAKYEVENLPGREYEIEENLIIDYTLVHSEPYGAKHTTLIKFLELLANNQWYDPINKWVKAYKDHPKRTTVEVLWRSFRLDLVDLRVDLNAVPNGRLSLKRVFHLEKEEEPVRRAYGVPNNQGSSKWNRPSGNSYQEQRRAPSNERFKGQRRDERRQKTPVEEYDPYRPSYSSYRDVAAKRPKLDSPDGNPNEYYPKREAWKETEAQKAEDPPRGIVERCEYMVMVDTMEKLIGRVEKLEMEKIETKSAMEDMEERIKELEKWKQDRVVKEASAIESLIERTEREQQYKEDKKKARREWRQERLQLFKMAFCDNLRSSESDQSDNESEVKIGKKVVKRKPPTEKNAETERKVISQEILVEECTEREAVEVLKPRPSLTCTISNKKKDKKNK